MRTFATDEFFPNLSGTFGKRRMFEIGPVSLGATRLATALVALTGLSLTA
jgi:hypothetical protein